uniref:Cytochrome P450 n=1 Tax=Vannella robusta TaxID=1487602 RepID=A0A6U1W3V7_9EUKA|mmetsp:Transcript_2607/g.3173  ORF Transcript_2607/g.3173 Transcript_2607/m.3173 type:complete len:503 (+) Transcript_2607:25-1533(+)
MWLEVVGGFLAIIGLGLVYLHIRTRNKFKNNFVTLSSGKSIEIPSATPLVSYAHSLPLCFKGFEGTDIMKQFDFTKQDTRNLKLWQGHMLALPVIYTWDPEISKNILFAKDDEIGKSNFGAELMDRFLGDSILQTSGEQWKRHKDVLSPAFQWKHIQSLLPHFIDLVGKLADTWENSNGTAQVDVSKMIKYATLDAIGRAGFGFDFKAVSGEASEELKQCEAVVPELNKSIHFFETLDKLLGTKKKLDKMLADFEYFMQSMISAKREQLQKEEENGTERDSKDILDYLLTGSSSITLSDREIVHNLNTFFIAGHETTSGALTSVLHFLARNPDAQKRARAEIESTCKGNELTYDDIRELKYGECCIKEALRLIPPAQVVMREAKKEAQVGNLHVAKGASFVVDIYSIHRNPEYWEDATEFKPERFLSENRDKIKRNTYFPFSIGPRQCIGNNFAMLELRTFLTVLLQRFQFDVDPKSPVDFAEYQGAVYTVAPGCTLLLTPL